MTRGRPRGTIPAHYCPVRDADAFRAMVDLLLTRLAAPGTRGGVFRDLAWRLDVSPALIHRYRRKAPAAITPEFFAALERVPLLVGQDAPFPFEQYFELLERAVDGENAEGTEPPHTTAAAFLPSVEAFGTLEQKLGAVVLYMRQSGKLSPDSVKSLPTWEWLHCESGDEQIIRKALEKMDNRRMITRPAPAGGVLILLQPV